MPAAAIGLSASQQQRSAKPDQEVRIRRARRWMVQPSCLQLILLQVVGLGAQSSVAVPAVGASDSLTVAGSSGRLLALL